METYNKACELLCLPSGRYYLVDTVKDKFKNRALVSHPDKGGENSAFIQLKQAYDIVREECEKELTKKTITPEGWEQHKTKSGELCYVHHPTKRVQWLFPTNSTDPLKAFFSDTLPDTNAFFSQTTSPASQEYAQQQAFNLFQQISHESRENTKRTIAESEQRYRNILHMSQPTLDAFMNDLSWYSAIELKNIAKFHTIKGYYKMTKSMLKMKLTDLYKKKHSI
jgi:hypothetical protein